MICWAPPKLVLNKHSKMYDSNFKNVFFKIILYNDILSTAELVLKMPKNMFGTIR